MKVVFSAPVDRESALNLDNYVFSINEVKYALGIAVDATHKDVKNLVVNSSGDFTKGGVVFDGKENSVTFRLQDSYPTKSATANVLQNADKYSIDVKDGVLSLDKSKKIPKYTDTQKEFTDTQAPKLVKVALNDANKLVLEFDEPVSALTATVDGVSVALASPSKAILDYTVESAAALAKELRKNGTHQVAAYNVEDVAAPIKNKATILTGSFTVTPDTTAPEVKEVRAVKTNDRAFDIVFSEPLKSFDATKLVVKKGNYRFKDNSSSAAAVGNSTTYKVEYAPLNADGSTGKPLVTPLAEGETQVVRVTFGSDDTVAPLNVLYGDAGSVSLSVDIENYRDMANLVGAKHSATVSLVKDVIAPKVDSEYKNKITGTLNPGAIHTDAKLEILFDKELSTNVSDTDKGKMTLTDKDGILRSIASATVTNTPMNKGVVTLVVTGLQDRDEMEKLAPYTLVFNEDSVTGKNEITNDKQTTKIHPSNNVADPVVEAVTSAIISGSEIKVTYNQEMSATAVELSNYTLDEAALPAETKISMDGTNKIVTITLPEGYTNVDVTKLLTISKRVMTKSGSSVVASVATKAPYTTSLEIADNTKPVIQSATYLVTDPSVDTTATKVKVVFSEKLGAVANNAATYADFKVLVNGTKQTITKTELVGERAVLLTLLVPVNVAQSASVEIVPVGDENAAMDIKDLAANKAKESTAAIQGKEKDVAALLAAAITQAEAAVGTYKTKVEESYADVDHAKAQKVDAETKIAAFKALAYPGDQDKFDARKAALDAKNIEQAVAYVETKVAAYEAKTVNNLANIKAAIVSMTVEGTAADTAVTKLGDASFDGKTAMAVAEFEVRISAQSDKISEAAKPVKIVLNPTTVTVKADASAESAEVEAKLFNKENVELDGLSGTVYAITFAWGTPVVETDVGSNSAEGQLNVLSGTAKKTKFKVDTAADKGDAWKVSFTASQGSVSVVTTEENQHLIVTAN